MTISPTLCDISFRQFAFERNLPESLWNELILSIRTGIVLAYPTDTLYGLGTIATHREGHAALLTLKGRQDTFPLICADLEMTDSLVNLSPAARRLAECFWPGPLTLVLPARGTSIPTAPDRTLALRVPAHDLLRKLVSNVGSPLWSTSVNAHGESPAISSPEVESWCRASGQVAMMLCDPAPPLRDSLPSTLVRFRGDDSPELIREGAIPAGDILRILG